MTASPDPTTAAVQAAQKHRLVESSACESRYRNKLLAGQSPSRVYEEYLSEGLAIDNAFEHQVEPWRQHFLDSNPGQTLPVFLSPGFQSFSTKQLAVQVPKKKKAQKSWMSALMAAFVGLFFLAGCMTLVTNSNSRKTDLPTTSTMTMEEKYIKLVRSETNLNSVSDAALVTLAKTACTHLTDGGTITEVLISVMDKIPDSDQNDVTKAVGFGIPAFCPSQQSKVG